MARVTVTSACNNGISQNFAFKDNGSLLRDASFSAYLDSGDETFIPKLFESTRSPAPADPPYHLNLGRKYNEAVELGIFSAEKYFSGRMDEMETKVGDKGRKEQLMRDGKIDLPRPAKKITYKSATPSTCSEASWNSQSALLQKDRSLNMQRQMSSGKKFFSNFGCNCSGKKSIDIDDKVGKNCRKIFDLREEPIFIQEPVEVVVTRAILAGNNQNRLRFRYGKDKLIDHGTTSDKGNFGLKKEDCFTSPIINPSAGTSLSSVGKQFEEEEEEKERASLEVFGAPHMGSDLHRRLSALNLNAAPRRNNISGDHVVIDDEDDLGSEASSDLFEIESLSSKGHHPCSSHPQASDHMQITFSLGDNIQKTKVNQEATTKIKEAHRRQPSSPLLSCKSVKAVNVVANAHRVSEKLEAADRHRRLQSDSMATLARFQAENRVLMDLDSRGGSAMQSLSRTYSMDAPHSLYMH